MISLLKLVIETTFIKISLNTKRTFHFFRSKLGKLSGALPDAPLCSKLLDAPR